MRKSSFVEGEFYHIYSHSIGNLDLFTSSRDYSRFLSALFAANGKREIYHLDRSRGLNLVSDIRDGKINIGESLVDIIGFCLMPNHFHLILRELSDGNISIFMHRILVSYSKYYNLKYERRGHVFERTFDAKHLHDDEYLMRALAYVNLNPEDLKQWRRKEVKYPWSSFQDYTEENRWGGLLKTKFMLDYFNSSKIELKEFIESARKDEYENLDLN
ncbi:transposase [Candidatus Giovannonibacteria bacterium]|nr:transposase [Candidatus Giovannonibacteria bacterium]